MILPIAQTEFNSNARKLNVKVLCEFYLVKGIVD